MKKLLIIFAVLCLAAPAMAADWNFYGQSRFATFYSIVDKDLNNDNDTINRTQWDGQTNSRIGATVKANDQIGGRFEFAVNSANVSTRILYGTYQFGGGSELLLGQTYTPTSHYFYSNQVFAGDNNLFNIGQFYAGRRAMVQWKTGGLRIAGVAPNTPADVPGTSAVDIIIPKIEASYEFKGDAWFADVFGGVQTYKIDYFVGNDPTITSWVAGGGGGMSFGAFYVNLGAHYGENLGNYGADSTNLLGGDQRGINNTGTIDANQDDVKNKSWGALGVLGFNLSDMMSLEAGVGYQTAEADLEGPAGDDESVWAVYVNMPINVAPGFVITPELGYAKYDYIETVAAGGEEPSPNVFYAGAKWQINF